MRSVVGAYMYMKEKTVDDIFVAQVNRMGAQLEIIENALAKAPRIMHRGGRNDANKAERDVPFHKWTPLKLKEKWFVYQDDVYHRANKKGLAFMKDNLERLKKEYPDSKKIKQADVDKETTKAAKEAKAAEKKLREDMPDYITKLEAAWTKAKDWPKPKWNV
jgi:hypothetical protein